MLSIPMQHSSQVSLSLASYITCKNQPKFTLGPDSSSAMAWLHNPMSAPANRLYTPKQADEQGQNEILDNVETKQELIS